MIKFEKYEYGYDTLDGAELEITLSNSAKMGKFKGKEFDLGNASEEDIEDFVEDLEDAMYDNDLEDLMEYFGKDRKCCIARELTKLHEEFYRGTLLEAYNYYQNGIKGEIVIVLDKKEREIAFQEISHDLLIQEINEVIESGNSCKDAIKIVAEKYNLQKNEVYRIYHN